tara:strand:- start:2652 stop:2768 length:117 start_codon:yes stop_codon:yes gene_type:complete
MKRTNGVSIVDSPNPAGTVSAAAMNAPNVIMKIIRKSI